VPSKSGIVQRFRPITGQLTSLACRHPAPDFVEEIHDQRCMTLGFSWLRALRRHQHDEALAGAVRIEVHSQADVRKPISVRASPAKYN
jgi:hypothetical protein